MNIEEVALRNNTYIQAVKLIKAAKSISETLPEYPEMNVLIIELDSMIINIKDRLLAYAKTSDKNMMIRIHQLDSIGDL